MYTYDFSKLSILMVEDNDFLAQVLQSTLLALRVGKVTRLKNGQQAIDHISSRSMDFNLLGPFGIDLILSDWQMSPVDGLEFLKWIRTNKSDNIRFLPFIMVTAFPEAKRVVAARNAGCTDFLRKPFTPISVVQRLIRVIENPVPFVETETYFGPDRRHSDLPFMGEDRRVAASAPLAKAS